jgi:TRAP-type C4-dicarboxylate transport system permease small subunit
VLANRKLIQRPIRVLTLVAGIALMLMMLHVVIDVAGRVFFNHPLNGTTEIVAGYYMVAVIFLPLGFVAHHEGHIKVELFTRALSPRRLAWLEAAVGIASVAFLLWFTWESIVSAQNSLETDEQWETAADLVTIWPSRWIVPIGLAVMTVYLILRLVDDIRAALASGAGSPGASATNPKD